MNRAAASILLKTHITGMRRIVLTVLIATILLLKLCTAAAPASNAENEALHRSDLAPGATDPQNFAEDLTDRYNEIYARMHGGMICDTLVEDIYRELEQDVHAVELEHRKEAGPDQRSLHLKMGANYTIDRILNPTREVPGSSNWNGYKEAFREGLRRGLIEQKTLFQSMWQGIPIKQLRAHVLRLKDRVCHRKGTVAEHYSPRYPPFPGDECGRCLEIMRDIGFVWLRSEARDKVTVYRTLESVCEDIEIRHLPHFRDDLREYCDELNSPEAMRETGITQALLETNSLDLVKESPFILGGYLSQKICVEGGLDSERHCSQKEVETQIKTMAQVPGRMFREGTRATTVAGRDEIKKVRDAHEAKMDSLRQKKNTADGGSVASGGRAPVPEGATWGRKEL